eukprot:UN03813
MGRPQFDNPQAPNYVTVEATNGAVLHYEYDMKRNIRPWDKTLYIKVVRGFLREGDQNYHSLLVINGKDLPACGSRLSVNIPS